MSQVALIKTATRRAEIGDEYEIQPDTVEMSGTGYEHATILQFAMSVMSLREIIKSKQPAIRRTPGKIEVETSPDVWVEISRKAKHKCNFDALTPENIEELKTSNKARSTAIFNNRLVACTIKQLPDLVV